MKKILVPCDFSQPSREAVRVANDIAHLSQGEIILFYAMPNPALYDPSMTGEGLVYVQQMIEDMEANAISKFERMKAEINRNAVPMSLVLRTGGLFTSIFDVIKSDNIDLVVMGTSGTSGLQEIFIGSNTERVIRFSPVPVLAVHSAFTAAGVKHIVVPSTLALDQTGFMTRIKGLQDFFKATLHILYINTPTHFRPDSDAREAYNEFVRHYNLENCQFHFRTHYKEEDGILEFMQTERLDLLAMGTHSRKGLSHLFNGSMTENVVNHAAFPVWTCSLTTPR
jgi:nucleotide-binding universal stress UspA family protein